MILKTVKFGEVEVNEDLIFNFIEPLLGYEELKKFAIIDHQPESPFKWLQSIENMDVALPVTIPAYFGIDYKFYLPEEKAKKLCIKDSESILTLNIVNIPHGNPKSTTVNLAGPVVINIENKNAIQLVLVNPDYSVKHKLFEEIKTESKV